MFHSGPSNGAHPSRRQQCLLHACSPTVTEPRSGWASPDSSHRSTIGGARHRQPHQFSWRGRSEVPPRNRGSIPGSTYLRAQGQALTTSPRSKVYHPRSHDEKRGQRAWLGIWVVLRMDVADQMQSGLNRDSLEQLSLVIGPEDIDLLQSPPTQQGSHDGKDGLQAAAAGRGLQCNVGLSQASPRCPPNGGYATLARQLGAL